MRPLRALGIYLAVVFVGGALIAPWLYWLTQWLAHAFPSLAEEPFHRFVNRSMLGVALIGLWPLFRSIGARSLNDVGLVQPAGQGKNLWGGFAVGFVSLAIVAMIVVAAGARHINPDLSEARYIKRLLEAALTAIVVAVLEEILFRGAIFGALRKVFDWKFALVLSSMIYAIVHFLESVDTTETITWLSGIKLLPRMLHGFANLSEIVPGFFNLTLAGVLLGLAFQRTGNLYFSIGLHAGWIFWLRSYVVFTDPVSDSQTWFWGTGKLINGWLALLVLAATLFAVQWMPFKQQNQRMP